MSTNDTKYYDNYKNFLEENPYDRTDLINGFKDSLFYEYDNGYSLLNERNLIQEIFEYGFSGLTYFIGGVAGYMLIPLLIALMVVLFKRFRTKGVFLKVSLAILFVIFFLHIFSSNSSNSPNVAWIVTTSIVAGLGLVIIGFIRGILTWLKKEII